MKKLLSILIIIFLITGCNSSIKETDDTKPTIIATIFPQYDFLKHICGDIANVELLISPGTESHNFEPSPSDIIKISKCDLFVYTGGESDVWVKTILNTPDLQNVKSIALSDIIPLITEKDLNEHLTDHNNHIGHNELYDEHVWTSPVNAIKICDALCEMLCSVDNTNENIYKTNCLKYTDEIKQLDTDVRQILSGKKRDLIIFGDRFPISYFTREYNIKYYSAFPGCMAETEPSPATLANLINIVNEKEIPVVFYIEFSDEKVADTICEATNAKKLLFHSAHNVTANEFNQGITYVEIMRKNISNLQEALN